AARSLPPEVAIGVRLVPVGPSHGSCGTAAYRGTPVIVRGIATDPLWDNPGREVVMAGGLRACWSVPVLSTSGAVLGTFANYYREPREPSPEGLGVGGGGGR